MGDYVLNFFHEKISKIYKQTFFFTFVLGLLTHIYKFTNTLFIGDSVYNYYSYNIGTLSLGRWSTDYMGIFSSFFDLPWINGLLSLLFLSLTAVVLVDIFRVTNSVLAFLIGGLLVTSPTTTEVIFWEYVSDAYLLALLLASVAVWITTPPHRQNLPRYLIAGLLLCLSCACYQAYISFALTLTFCVCIVMILDEKGPLSREQLLWCVRQALLYICSLAGYFVIWKLLMRIAHTPSNPYQGVDSIGRISPSMLLTALVKSVRGFIEFFFQWNVFRNGLSVYIVLNLLFWLFFAAALAAAVFKSRLLQKPLSLLLLILSVSAACLSPFIWNFTSPNVEYALRMEQGLILIYVLAAVLAERWLKPSLSSLLALVLAALIFNGVVQANICYWYMQRAADANRTMGAEVMSRIHMMDTDSTEMLVLGQRDTSLINYYPEYSRDPRANTVHVTGRLLASDNLYDGSHLIHYLNDTYAAGKYFSGTSAERTEELLAMEAVQKMGCWPASDSVQLIDGTIVIKLSDVEAAQ